MSSPLQPPISLLCKVGSIITHLEEGMGKKNHAFDLIALKALLKDKEVIEWLRKMDELALIPKKR